MKFVIDQPVSPRVAEWLCDAGHDAFHLRERGLSRLPDDQIVALAVAENRIIVTADLDFTRIITLSGKAGPGLILFRAGNISDDRMLALVQTVLADVDEQRLLRSVTVVDLHSIRVAPLPIRPDLAD